MAIKFEILGDNSQFIDSMKKVQESVHNTSKAVTDAFDEQAAVVEELSNKMATLAAEIEQADKAGDTKTVEEKRKAYDELGKEFEEEKQAFLDMQSAFGKMSGTDTAEKSSMSLRARLKELNQQIAELTLEYRSMSESEQQSAGGQALQQKIHKLTEEAGTLRDAMDDANRSVKGVASDTKNFDALAGGINVAASAVGAYTGVLSMFGAKEEELAEIQTKLQASLAITNGLSQIQNNIQKESDLMRGVRIIKEKALAAGIAIRNAAEGKGVIATKAATIAQKAFNLVAKANPYVLLATSLLTVVGALYAYSKGSEAAKKKEEELAKAAEETEQRIKEAHDTMVSASSEAVNMASKISSLQTAYMKANSEFEKTQILKEAAAQFKSLGLECNSLTDAQRLLINQGGAVIEMLRLQGTVAALTALRMEAFKKSFSAILENNGDINYAASLAGFNAQVMDYDALIAQYQGRIGKIQSTLPMKGSGGSGTPKTKTTKTTGQSPEETAQKKAELELRNQRERARAARDLELSTREAEIQAMQEGTAKTIKQIELDRDKELEAIERAYEDLKVKRIDEAKSLWEADPNNKGKNFFESDAYRKAESDDTYTAEERENRRKRISAAWTVYLKSNEEIRRADELAWRDYLKQYGDYQQKRQAIKEEYAEKVDKAQNLGDILALKEQEKAALNELDERYGLVTQAMADLFADASKKSVKAIQAIIDKYEALVKYMEGHKGSASVNDLAAFGLSQDDINKIVKGEISIKELTDRLKDLKGELKNRSPWQNFKKNIEEAVKMLNGANGDRDKLGTAISNIGTACAEYLPELQRFGSALANIFGMDDSVVSNVASAIGGLSNATNGIGQIISGNYIDGVINATDGLATAFNNFVSAINTLARGRNMEYVYGHTELEAIRKSVDLILEKMDESTTADAIKEYNDALERYTQGLAISQGNLDEAMRRSSHNISGRLRHRSVSHHMYDFGGEEEMGLINRLLGTNLTRWEDLWMLSPEQLAEVQRELPHVFSIIYKAIEKLNEEASESSDDENARQALEEYLDWEGKKKEIEDKFREKMTGTTLSSIRSEFKDILSDMTNDASKFSENFEEMLANAVINSMMADKYNEELKKWYEAFSDAFMSDVISNEEVEQLRMRYESIVNDAVAERDELYKALGINPSSSEAEAAYNASKTFTQEQGDVLNGRLAAIQEGQARAYLQDQQFGQQIVATLTMMADMTSSDAERNTAVLEIRNMMVMANSHLDDISTYTRRMLNEFSDKMDKIVYNTQNL